MVKGIYTLYSYTVRGLRNYTTLKVKIVEEFSGSGELYGCLKGGNFYFLGITLMTYVVFVVQNISQNLFSMQKVWM